MNKWICGFLKRILLRVHSISILSVVRMCTLLLSIAGDDDEEDDDDADADEADGGGSRKSKKKSK